MRKLCILVLLLLPLVACTLEEVNNSSGGSGEMAVVTRVIDGDTIDVQMNGQTFRVRYVGVNTPERDESCYSEATAFNRSLVEGRSIRMERDQSNTDRYDRLLRYIYVGDTFVNAEMVRNGYAEVVLYEPDDREYDNFRNLEQAAARDNLNCHATGIFNDGTYAR